MQPAVSTRWHHILPYIAVPFTPRDGPPKPMLLSMNFADPRGCREGEGAPSRQGQAAGSRPHHQPAGPRVSFTPQLYPLYIYPAAGSTACRCRWVVGEAPAPGNGSSPHGRHLLPTSPVAAHRSSSSGSSLVTACTTTGSRLPAWSLALDRYLGRSMFCPPCVSTIVCCLLFVWLTPSWKPSTHQPGMRNRRQ